MPYSIIRCIDVCHWLSWEHSYNVVILEGIEINEQLSLRNSLNAPLLSDELDELCFSHNVYDRSIEINEQLSQMNSLNAFCYRLN